MATVLEDVLPKSLLLRVFLCAEELDAKAINKEIFPLSVGSVCRVRLFTTLGASTTYNKDIFTFLGGSCIVRE
jgi:hypothetical protein